jgi:CDP-diacylglycerol pyrophosphatase
MRTILPHPERGARRRAKSKDAWLPALFLVLVSACAAKGDPDALWHIVHDECVPDETQHHDPAPCALVDLERGYAVLKDRVGNTQFLVLPTARIPGIESPELLAPDAENYMEDAWAARRFVVARAGRDLPREDIALAVNSAAGRTQNQLHIHVDCIRADVRDALAHQAAADDWAPFPAPLAGHHYIARRIAADDLDGVNPFRLLGESSPDARQHMGDDALVLAGMPQGFVLLAARGDPSAGESIEDHACALGS